VRSAPVEACALRAGRPTTCGLVWVELELARHPPWDREPRECMRRRVPRVQPEPFAQILGIESHRARVRRARGSDGHRRAVRCITPVHPAARIDSAHGEISMSLRVQARSSAGGKEMRCVPPTELTFERTEVRRRRLFSIRADQKRIGPRLLRARKPAPRCHRRAFVVSLVGAFSWIPDGRLRDKGRRRPMSSGSVASRSAAAQFQMTAATSREPVAARFPSGLSLARIPSAPHSSSFSARVGTRVASRPRRGARRSVAGSTHTSTSPRPASSERRSGNGLAWDVSRILSRHHQQSN
jgi:hypothetical protein